jgi:hypothetical protein
MTGRSLETAVSHRMHMAGECVPGSDEIELQALLFPTSFTTWCYLAAFFYS